MLENSTDAVDKAMVEALDAVRKGMWLERRQGLIGVSGDSIMSPAGLLRGRFVVQGKSLVAAGPNAPPEAARFVSAARTLGTPSSSRSSGAGAEALLGVSQPVPALAAAASGVRLHVPGNDANAVVRGGDFAVPARTRAETIVSSNDVPPLEQPKTAERKYLAA
mmetsp:Transcript_57256/g.159349  ORF Transcript_57256/g.159349 Transcript_57256/m.159349 type:complete len:164 (+) Transcript_57256:1479-1970(+)